jgi:hypothetical protein
MSSTEWIFPDASDFLHWRFIRSRGLAKKNNRVNGFIPVVSSGASQVYHVHHDHNKLLCPSFVDTLFYYMFLDIVYI